MRFLLKILVIVVIGFVLYHFFGPQIDDLYVKAKSSLTEMIHKGTADTHRSTDQEHKYYPIQKRSQ